MTTLSKSFAAVGSGPEFLLAPGQSLEYSLSGTFTGAVHFERSRSSGLAWEVLDSAETTLSGSVKNSSKGTDRFRMRATKNAAAQAWSGTAVTSIADADDVLAEFKRPDGSVYLRVRDDGVDLTGSVRKILVNAAGQAKAGTTAGWVVAGADNVGLVTCPAAKTAATLVVPLPSLKVGDTITGFHLVGQIESAGNTATLDADLRKHTAAAADVTDASVGAITQVSVTADTILSASNSRKASLSEVVGVNETFYVLLTATTAASTDVALQAVAIEITEA